MTTFARLRDRMLQLTRLYKRTPTPLCKIIAQIKAMELALKVNDTGSRVCIPFGMLRLERSVTHQILGTSVD